MADSDHEAVRRLPRDGRADAHLPAEDYRDAFANSRRFLEYKRITLDQCQVGTSA